MKQKIVEPYAQALFRLKDDIDLTPLWEMARDSKFMQLLMNPSIPKEKKWQLFQPFDKLVQSWLEVIWKKKRMNLLAEICASYLELRKKKEGIVTVFVTSATPLTDTQTQQLEVQLTRMCQAKHLQCEYQVDAQLLAGLKIQMNGQLIDTSWQTQLKQLMKSLW
jgi:ATP synthase F1 delta subunit|uniref:ATP synthase subunit delta, chloroplastic n=2 Tax=Cyanidioschyzon merolae TaxID=45157 RepID=ATPD_CYAM1|nr:ATP synthase CF1 delta chain [Cyanidioschyzon merolae strain 10D]Q85FQ9.1 RecName: Full=ATP synthase subunit delta, chloroplastic; AltName: Full=ATP synthase F(1) sector subunit delta; AltName: Full=F-type ATPase subunit delta [Cyanidioschyzon merolae strain 10D]QFV17070.1 ATP synthase CF1 delta chain [Cyanidioschyzon merolae]QFV17243.1 ATP synthase CF1 delta chain [Cyanidioschyzon merolae]BAC76286.1 ATP synthase CF1 delta chain [Cyanidioschyzon merolae strain 10D]